MIKARAVWCKHLMIEGRDIPEDRIVERFDKFDDAVLFALKAEYMDLNYMVAEIILEDATHPVGFNFAVIDLSFSPQGDTKEVIH